MEIFISINYVYHSFYYRASHVNIFYVINVYLYVMHLPSHTVRVFMIIALRSSADVVKNYYTGYKIHCLA